MIKKKKKIECLTPISKSSWGCRDSLVTKASLSGVSIPALNLPCAYVQVVFSLIYVCSCFTPCLCDPATEVVTLIKRLIVIGFNVLNKTDKKMKLTGVLENVVFTKGPYIFWQSWKGPYLLYFYTNSCSDGVTMTISFST